MTPSWPRCRSSCSTIIDEKARGYTLGAADYLIKPIDRGQLTAVLERHCSPRGRVLIADDDPDLGERTREMISRDGFQVIEAGKRARGIRPARDRAAGCDLARSADAGNGRLRFFG